MFCSNCACELPAIAKFCVRCGSHTGTSTQPQAVSVEIMASPKITSEFIPGVCAKCGAQNPDDYSFCSSCGTPLQSGSTILRHTPAVALETAPASVTKKEISDRAMQPVIAGDGSAELRGIGGWLLFFCVTVTLVGPLVNIAEIAQNPNDSVTVALDLMLAVFKIITGVVVWRISPYALKLVKAYFIVTLVISCLSVVGSLSTNLNDVAHQSAPSNGLGAGFQGLIGVILWWSYFRKSRRVKATFGSNL
jgi:ribosomal protein L40E